MKKTSISASENGTVHFGYGPFRTHTSFVNDLSEIISREIADRGAIPFARFMELALYCPGQGYYERDPDTVGRTGDYFTSVSVGNLFGELLAVRFADWLENDSSLWRLVEAGGHRGDLARDILSWLQAWRTPLFERVEYCLVEPSARRRAWQARTLDSFGPKVRWVDQLSDLRGTGPDSGVRGIIFANELLDAFPVNRLVWDAARQRWIELGVTLRQGQFEWVRLEEMGLPAARQGAGPKGEPAPGLPPDALIPTADLAAVLPDGFIFDYCPQAWACWHQAAALLTKGRLLTFDYGLTTDALFSPERQGGTLRAYARHQPSTNLLANPGKQDLTAHVDFSALQTAGEAAGLATETFETQGQFLTRIAADIWKGKARFGAWSEKHNRQFLTLTHPEHLGSRFRVLVQKTPTETRNSG